MVKLIALTTISFLSFSSAFAGVISNESLPYQEWKFQNKFDSTAGWTTASNEDYPRNIYYGGAMWDTTAYDKDSSSLLAGLDYKNKINNYYLGRWLPTGRIIEFRSPVLQVNNNNTKKFYTSFEVKSSSNANINSVGLVIEKGVQWGTAVEDLTIINKGNGKHLVSFAAHTNNHSSIVENSRLKYHLRTDVQTSEMFIDNVTLSLDKPLFDVPNNLKSIKIGDDSYFIDISKDFDGVYNAAGQRVNTSIEVAAQLLQSHQTLREFVRFEPEALKTNLLKAYHAKVFSDEIEFAKSSLVSVAGALTTTAAGVPIAPGVIADAVGILYNAGHQEVINYFLGVVLHSAITSVDNAIEAKNRYLSEVNREINIEDLRIYSQEKSRISGYSMAAVKIIEANMHGSGNFYDNLFSAFQDYVFSVAGAKATAANIALDVIENASGFENVVKLIAEVRDQSSFYAMDSNYVELYKQIVIDNGYNISNVNANPFDENPLDEYVSYKAEDIFADHTRLSYFDHLLVFSGGSDESDLLFSGPGSGSLVSSPLGSNAKVINLVTGSPISVDVIDVAVPEHDFWFSFGLLWETSSGYLQVFLDDYLIDTIYAPESLSFNFDYYSYFLDSALFGNSDFFDVKFLFDGPKNSSIYIDSIDFYSERATLNAISAPSTFYLMVYFMLFLIFTKRVVSGNAVLKRYRSTL